MSDREEQRLRKHKMMTEDRLSELIVRMAIPTIISMLITSIYNMVDTFFVGQLSTSATAGVGIIFPLMNSVQVIGFFFGQGSGSYISRLLGAQETKEASRMAAVGFFSSFGVSIPLVTGAFFIIPQIVRLLGSTVTIQPYAEQYLFYILFGVPFMAGSLVLSTQLRLQGNAQYAMVAVGIGAALNILLDPLLIFAFGLGVAGAAIATSTSQIISFCILLAGSKRGSSLPIRFKDFTPNRELYLEIIKTGLPSLCRQSLATILIIVLNIAAAAYGDAAVAAFSIVNRVIFIVVSILIGFGQGYQPVCGFNYGARCYNRVIDGFWFCVKVSIVGMAIFAVFGVIFARKIIAAFRKDDMEVILIGALALRLQCVTLPLIAWVILCNMLTQSIGAFISAVLLSVGREGLFFPAVNLYPSAFYGNIGCTVVTANCCPAQLCSSTTCWR